MYRELSTAFTERAAATLAAKQLEADVEEARLTHARVSEALDQARKELQQGLPKCLLNVTYFGFPCAAFQNHFLDSLARLF